MKRLPFVVVLSLLVLSVASPVAAQDTGPWGGYLAPITRSYDSQVLWLVPAFIGVLTVYFGSQLALDFAVGVVHAIRRALQK